MQTKIYCNVCLPVSLSFVNLNTCGMLWLCIGVRQGWNHSLKLNTFLSRSAVQDIFGTAFGMSSNNRLKVGTANLAMCIDILKEKI